MFIFIKISMSVHQGHTTAMLILTVPTPRDRFIAGVIRDTLEMESRAWVSVSASVEMCNLVKGQF